MKDAPDLVLQRFNLSVFPEVQTVMENVARVSQHLQSKVQAREGDRNREALRLVLTRTGETYWHHDPTTCYRAFVHIDQTVAYEEATPARLKAAAQAFGRFVKDLSDLPKPDLKETLAGFHDTPARYEALRGSAEADPHSRAADCQSELDRLKSFEADLGVITQPLAKGTIPTRTCHNDTKLNNVLFDAATDSPLCVIDLDTVMPGSVLYDFGDAVRFAAATAPEEGAEGVVMDLCLERFSAFTEGFLGETQEILTEEEIRLLPRACRAITLELASRFLKDHLDGDVYFKSSQMGQNLRRARAQLDLAEAMRRRESEMDQAIQRALT